jgi:hypothetical protein
VARSAIKTHLGFIFLCAYHYKLNDIEQAKQNNVISRLREKGVK